MTPRLLSRLLDFLDSDREAPLGPVEGRALRSGVVDLVLPLSAPPGASEVKVLT